MICAAPKCSQWVQPTAVQVDVWDIERSRDVLGDPLVLEGDCIVSCSTSSDSSRLLLNMASRAVHLWTIPKKHSKEEARLLVRFRGAKERQSRCCPPSHQT